MRAQALQGLPRDAAGHEQGGAVAALLVLNLVWGGSLPATKLALDGFGPFTLAAARLLLASLLFLPFVWTVRGPSLRTGYVLRVGCLGVLGFTGTQTLQALGAGGTTGATASVLASTGPLWMVLLAPLVVSERPRPLALIGIVVALAGVVLVVDPGRLPGPGDAGALVSNAVVLLSSGAFALYSLLGKAFDRAHSPTVFTGISCWGGALAALPLAGLELTGVQPVPTPLSWAMLAYLGVVVTFAGFIVWFWGLRRVPAARAAPLLFLQPLSGLVLSALILGERLPSIFLLGTALVLAGVYLAARR